MTRASPNLQGGASGPTQPLAGSLRQVSHRYGKIQALNDVSVEFPADCLTGLIGPDGVGKSTLLALLAGARRVQQGEVHALGANLASAQQRTAVGPRIAYMPQGLGKNLYPTLTVWENLDSFARLFGQRRAEREARMHELLQATGLAPFPHRPAGKLSGGMKQKLGLCCALIHDPDLLILDEPTTGVDPLARRQFWELIDHIRSQRPGMGVVVATAYLDEAATFDRLVAMDGGQVLATGKPQELQERTGTDTLDDAFIALLPESRRAGHRQLTIPPREESQDSTPVIEAQNLTMRFGDFTAVDNVSFRIARGEIFGFLGSNGCGKTTTMKMLTGLLPASEGRAWLLGHEVDPRDLDTRRRVGYMSQSFSLYVELTVRQNLSMHAKLFQLPADEVDARVAEMAERFELVDILDQLPSALPLGVTQRLSLAVAMIHKPEILILDEPTSGVDPIARDALWQSLIDLSRRDGVTIFLSTHFMSEARRCDRMSLMHAGRVLVSDTPEAIAAPYDGDLEAAFVDYLLVASGEGEEAASKREAGREEAEPSPQELSFHEGNGEGGSELGEESQNPSARRVRTAESATSATAAPASTTVTAPPSTDAPRRFFDLGRLLGVASRESMELRRDPIRAAFAFFGSLVLLLVLGYGISMDVEDLPFAVLDYDQTTLSRQYAHDIAGSRYFTERPPLLDADDRDRRMRSGELSLAIEIPPGFARDVARGRPVSIGAWIDGAMPSRAETAEAYVEGIHAHWLQQQARLLGPNVNAAQPFTLETRFRYNPNVESLIAMVPAVIGLVLLFIPTMLATLSIVREKELGSIVNLYVTPVSRLEFLLGKQLPYVVLAMINVLLLTAVGVFVLGVPFTGSLSAYLLGALAYAVAATGLGLLISTFMSSQIAAIFLTTVLTMTLAVQYSGMIDPIASLEGFAAFMGQINPASHFITISRGAFVKALDFNDLGPSLLALAAAGPVLLVLGVLLLRKQAR